MATTLYLAYKFQFVELSNHTTFAYFYLNSAPFGYSLAEKNPHLSATSVGSFQRNKSLTGFVKCSPSVKYCFAMWNALWRVRGFISFHLMRQHQISQWLQVIISHPKDISLLMRIKSWRVRSMQEIDPSCHPERGSPSRRIFALILCTHCISRRNAKIPPFRFAPVGMTLFFQVWRDFKYCNSKPFFPFPPQI